ncbi:MAG: dienelactone hydrolase family protein [Myxococcota bacterium]
MKRRVFLLAVFAAPSLVACDFKTAEVSAKADGPEPLNYIERFTGGAVPSDRLPLVVVLHGRGDVPENFTKRLEGYPGKARFIYLEAPIDEGKGRGWFTFDRMPGGWKRTSDKVKLLGERVVVTVDALERAHQPLGKPVLTGFSQGAMVVYAAILAHPERFHAALPVSGALFESSLPPDLERLAPKLPPVIAFHGDEDPIISARASKEAVTMLDAYGAVAEVRTFPEIPHWIMGDMKNDLLAEIEKCVADSVARD